MKFFILVIIIALAYWFLPYSSNSHAISLCKYMPFVKCADEKYNIGYKDGNAEGYNTECKIRATLVRGWWDDKAYSRGYEAGRITGIEECRKDRREGRR